MFPPLFQDQRFHGASPDRVQKETLVTLPSDMGDQGVFQADRQLVHGFGPEGFENRALVRPLRLATMRDSSFSVRVARSRPGMAGSF